MAVVGGEKAWKIKQYGDVVASFQWVNEEPAIILFPRKKQAFTRGAFVVALSALHQYVNSDGYPNTDYLIPQSAKAADFMGMEVTQFSVKQIADAILDSAEDLVRMPPEPPGMTEKQHNQAVGEAKIMVDGKVVLHDEFAAPEGL
jgi:hypothetical protein